jgi:hypothetical protein
VLVALPAPIIIIQSVVRRKALIIPVMIACLSVLAMPETEHTVLQGPN